MADVTPRQKPKPAPNRVADSPSSVRIYDPPALGSWKGMEFLAASCESSGGRSIAKIPLPYIPGQIVHDLGRKGEAHTVKTVWIGGDWRARLENFRAVIAGQATSGELALPDGGDVLTAHVDTWTIPRQYEDARDSGEMTIVWVEDSQVDVVLTRRGISSLKDGVPTSDEVVHALIDKWESTMNDPDATSDERQTAYENAAAAIQDSEDDLDTDTVDGVEAEEGYERTKGDLAEATEDAGTEWPEPYSGGW